MWNPRLILIRGEDPATCLSAYVVLMISIRGTLILQLSSEHRRTRIFPSRACG